MFVAMFCTLRATELGQVSNRDPGRPTGKGQAI